MEVTHGQVLSASCPPLHAGLVCDTALKLSYMPLSEMEISNSLQLIRLKTAIIGAVTRQLMDCCTIEK